ncbi:phage scaffolding protein [Paenibacillus woosongensis]|uniref:Phage scaffolding protein n=1 Tax=Paenibacillus woosongensis TaxID=307580 RepID=A0AA95L2Y3_9BACL|nr:phage scaffolding protein [Paenibacillus woosongensis]WHX50547.1 phage scaffolding protein [Paenibacillus woosongensis]
MDWLKELLKKLGVAEADVDKIDAEVRKELPMHFVPKSQYNELSEAKKKAEKDIAERDKQIADLGKTAGLSEELKKQIETLQTENQAAAERYAAELHDIKMTNALRQKLEGKVHDVDLVIGMLDKQVIKLGDDGNIVQGYEEQEKTLQESKAFLWKQEDNQQQQQSPPGFRVGGGGNPNPPAATLTLKDAIAAHFQK